MIKDTERTMQTLEDVSLGLAAHPDNDLFDELADQILAVFKRSDIKDIDAFVLRDITHVICGKLMFLSGENFRENARRLYLFLKEKRLTSALFEKFLDEKISQLADPKKESNSSSMDIQAIPCDPMQSSKKVIASLKTLLKTDAKSNSIDKNLGFALLDLEGNFLLLCKKSLHYFGVKHSECKIFNFFSLMIPFSKQTLAKRFGPEMFQEDSHGPITRNFNYVIYSRTAMKKFYNILRNKTIESKEELDHKLESLESSANGKDLYNAYLTALTSSATMITMRYSETDIAEWNEEKLLFKKNAKYLETNLLSEEIKLLKDQPEILDPLFNSKQPQGDFRSIHLKVTNAEVNRVNSNTECLRTEKVFTKKMILLKTRYSKTVPAFNYQELKHQGMILNFKQYLRNKVFAEGEANFDVNSDA